MSRDIYCSNCFELNTEKNSHCHKCGFLLRGRNEAHQLGRNTILNGRYLVGRCLGEGGFGISYVGYDLMLSIKVAIKEYFPFGAANRSNALQVYPVAGGVDSAFERGKQRFLNEAEVLSAVLDIPSVVKIRDFFEENGTAYIVMEYLEGMDLRAFSKSRGKVGFDELYGMFRPLLEDIEKLHQKGVIHRDISPSNIILQPSGELRILDFGAARQQDKPIADDDFLLLKAHYAPPEQFATKEQQGPWTDIYALCATIYSLVTADTPEASMDRVHDDKLIKPRKLGADINPAAEEVLLRGMAVEKSRRIGDIKELLHHFDRAAQGKRIYPSGAKKWIVTAVTAAAAILLLVFVFSPDKGDDKPSKGSASTAYPSIKPAETLSPDAHKVKLYYGMEKIKDFKRQELFSRDGFTLAVDEAFIGNHTLSFVLHANNNSIEQVDMYAWRHCPDPNDKYSGTELNVMDVRTQIKTGEERYFRLDFNTDVLALDGFASFGELNFTCQMELLGEYVNEIYTVTFPEKIEINSSFSDKKPVRVDFADHKVDCYGLSVIDNADVAYMILRNAVPGNSSLSIQNYSFILVDDIRIENRDYSSVFFSKYDAQEMCMLKFNCAYSALTDSMNIIRTDREMPRNIELVLELSQSGDEKSISYLRMCFEIDENGVGTLVSAIEE